MIPKNLLNMAMSITGNQQFTYLKFLSRTTNDIGIDVPVYDVPRILKGQVQAVPRDLFQTYGLEFNKSYLTFYVSKEIKDIQRDVSGDQIKYAGCTYSCLSETDWHAINGWTGVLCVKVSE